MPVIAVIENIKVCVNPGDHNPPHIHVLTTHGAALVRISDGRLLAGAIRSKDLASVLAWLAGNRSMAMQAWETYNARG